MKKITYHNEGSMTDSWLSKALFSAKAIKIDFKKGWTMKNGSWSPIYINLRVLQSHPKILRKIAKEMWIVIQKKKIRFDLVASIPLGAVPLGIAFSLTSNKPHVLPRMSSKKHGLGVMVDGVFQAGQKVLLVDDLITAATSKIEAIDELKQAKLKVSDLSVVLDREQGGTEIMKKNNIALHSLITLKRLLFSLEKQQLITKTTKEKLDAYLAQQ